MELSLIISSFHSFGVNSIVRAPRTLFVVAEFRVVKLIGIPLLSFRINGRSVVLFVITVEPADMFSLTRRISPSNVFATKRSCSLEGLEEFVGLYNIESTVIFEELSPPNLNPVSSSIDLIWLVASSSVLSK